MAIIVLNRHRAVGKFIATHVNDEDNGVAKCDPIGGTQKTMLINESGPAWERYMGANLR